MKLALEKHLEVDEQFYWLGFLLRSWWTEMRCQGCDSQEFKHIRSKSREVSGRTNCCVNKRYASTKENDSSRYNIYKNVIQQEEWVGIFSHELISPQIALWLFIPNMWKPWQKLNCSLTFSCCYWIRQIWLVAGANSDVIDIVTKDALARRKAGQGTGWTWTRTQKPSVILQGKQPGTQYMVKQRINSEV